MERSLNATQLSEEASKSAQRNLENTIFEYESQIEFMKQEMEAKYMEIENWRSSFACMSQNLTETTNCLNELSQAKFKLEREYQAHIQMLQSKLDDVLQDSETKAKSNTDRTLRLEAELNSTVSRCQELLRRNDVLTTEINTQKNIYEQKLIQSLEAAKKEREILIQKAISEAKNSYQVEYDSLTSKIKQAEMMVPLLLNMK